VATAIFIAICEAVGAN
jgi:hypothetical protein